MKAIIESGIKRLFRDKPVRMHMPGHKGRIRNYRYDITEVPGADTLQDPRGIIKEAEEKIAGMVSSEDALFTVGGSTSGIQTAVASAAGPGEKILIPINAHYSVYPAIAFSGAVPVLYQPSAEYPGMRVRLEDVVRAHERCPDAKALFLTSPDYYGMISDVDEIISYCKENDIITIVDAAHGAHLPFISGTVAGVGADYTIQSAHKTLSAPTQGGMLFLNGPDRSRVQRIANLYQTSSPSYMILSGVEKAYDDAAERAEAVFSRIYRAHDALERELVGTPVELVSSQNYDKSKFVFLVPEAEAFAEILRDEYGIIPELAAGDTIICMTGINTSQRDLNRLLGGVKELAGKWQGEKSPPRVYPTPKQVVDLREAVYARSGENVPLEQSAGRISGDFIIPYPPGIPVAFPGSLITEELVGLLESLDSPVRGISPEREVFVLEEI